MNYYLFNKLLLVSLLTILSATSYAEDKAIIIFDASGSMWGRINGRTKIAIAKETLEKVVTNWNEQKSLGLLAYGHRRKGDCNDIQTLVSVGRVDKKAMIATVQQISPKGKTPISASIKIAANELKFTEDSATIILISDGKETCHADPCKTAAELEKLGVNLTAHVIGFDVDKETSKQLKCIATNTGGQYFPANSAEQLNQALEKVAEQLITTKAVDTSLHQIKKEPKIIKNNLRISTYYATKPITSKYIGVYKDVKNEFNKHTLKQVSIARYKNKGAFNLPAGDYLIKSKAGNVAIEKHITIDPSHLTDIQLNYDAGKLKAHAVLTSDGTAQQSRAITIYSLKTNESSKPTLKKVADKLYKNIGDFFLPPGDYIVKARSSFSGNANAEAKITIETGRSVESILNFHAGKLNVHTIRSVGNKPAQSEKIVVYTEVLNESGKAKLQKVAEGLFTTKVSFVLKAGDYVIKAWNKKEVAQTTVHINEGEDRSLELALKEPNCENTGKSVSAVWNSKWKELTLHRNGNNISGVYKYKNGTLEGEMTHPKSLDAYWTQSYSRQKCTKKYNGHDYWGRTTLVFNDNLCSFKAKWGYCNEELNRDWFGSYLSAFPENDQINKSNSKHAKNLVNNLTQSTKNNIVKVENNLGGELDYSKKVLPISVKILSEKTIKIGEIHNNGEIHFDLPDVKVAPQYIKLYGENPISLEKMFNMGSCTNKGKPLKNTYQGIYSHKIKNIQISLFDITVGSIIPLSDKSLLDEGENQKKVLQKGSTYSFILLDKDTHYKKNCSTDYYEGIYDLNINVHADLKLKKGWNLIEKRTEEIQDYNNAERNYHTQVPKRIGYYLAKINDANVKWYSKRYAKDGDIQLIEKIVKAKPLDEASMTQTVPKKLGELTLVSKEYGKQLPRSNNSHTFHLHYASSNNKEKALDIYISDTAGDPETLLQAKQIYKMEAEYGENKGNNIPYVAQSKRGKSKLIYILNDRFVINAQATHITPAEIWKDIQALSLDGMLKH